MSKLVRPDAGNVLTERKEPADDAVDVSEDVSKRIALLQSIGVLSSWKT